MPTQILKTAKEAPKQKWWLEFCFTVRVLLNHYTTYKCHLKSAVRRYKLFSESLFSTLNHWIMLIGGSAHHPSGGKKSQPGHAGPAWLAVQRSEAKRAFPGLCSFLNVLFHKDMSKSFTWFNLVSIFKTSQLIGSARSPMGTTPPTGNQISVNHDTHTQEHQRARVNPNQFLTFSVSYRSVQIKICTKYL